MVVVREMLQILDAASGDGGIAANPVVDAEFRELFFDLRGIPVSVIVTLVPTHSLMFEISYHYINH
jgi:hypothetical protein